ncbi:MAG: hypothetical protein RIT10_1129 [Bacteroidota bacterium]|jgi:RNA polymerase sigma-70 factor (ECF subfamily)
MRLFRPKYTEFSDEQLMLQLSVGQKGAFDELYKRYASLMLSYFNRMLWRDREKAEDFMHDLFAKIIKDPTVFDPTKNFKTWFYSVANNMCKNEYKKMEVRKGTSNGLDQHYTLSDQSSNVFNEVHDQFFSQAFELSLDELDEKHAVVFKMRHLDGLSIKEIAEIIEINEGTVKSRLFNATKKMAENLKEFNPIEL